MYLNGKMMELPKELEDKMSELGLPIVYGMEWLKKKYNEADNAGMGIDDWSVKDCYGYVIKAWEKENENR